MSQPAKYTPVNDEAIEAMAAAWLVQRDEGFSAEQAAEFSRWQKADPRHAAAVAMLEETCSILETMPQVREKLRAENAAGDRRGPMKAKIIRFPTPLKTAAVIAACFLAMFAIWRFWPGRNAITFAGVYATASKDGYQRVVLPDQSVIELNANTEVRVTFSEHRRDLTLARGEAHFTVAKNPARPFVVSTGRVAVRAVGTVFAVRIAPSSVDVLVTEGRVEVSRANSGAAKADAPLLLGAGQRAVVPHESAPTVATLDLAAMSTALAWQNPPLISLDAPLADVVKQFNQRNRVQLSIVDPDLGTRAVGGAFRADQVEAFVRLLEESRDIAVEHRDPEHIVLRKVR
jgi:transmembrane sensor